MSDVRPSMASEVPSRSRGLIHAFVGLFLTLQLLLPLPALLQSQTETRGILSWNMYAERYRCTARYYAVSNTGERTPIPVRRYFNNSDRVGLIRHRDVLPRFHAWLCEDLDVANSAVTLQGTVACSANHGPEIQLVRPGIDLCRAPSYGVEGAEREIAGSSGP